jgi:hypothetical protein
VCARFDEPGRVLKDVESELDRGALRERRKPFRTLHGVGAPPVRADQSLVAQLVENSSDDIGLRRWKDGNVELVQVDVVGAESSERILTCLPDVRRGHVPPDDAPVVFVDDSTELRSENNAVAAIVCRKAKHLLSVAGSVHVGHVEEVDALVDRRVDRADRLVVVHRPPTCLRPLQQEGAADGPTAKPYSRHPDVRSAESPDDRRLRDIFVPGLQLASVPGSCRVSGSAAGLRVYTKRYPSRARMPGRQGLGSPGLGGGETH